MPIILGFAVFLIMFGLALGFIRRWWEKAGDEDAFPAAVRVSRWAGVIGTCVIIVMGLRSTNLESRGAPIALIGAVVWLPLLGAAFCWLTRPLIYLAALIFFRLTPIR